MNILLHGRIDVCEGIDINETGTLQECDICHCWYFLIKDLSIN